MYIITVYMSVKEKRCRHPKAFQSAAVNNII